MVLFVNKKNFLSMVFFYRACYLITKLCFLTFSFSIAFSLIESSSSFILIWIVPLTFPFTWTAISFVSSIRSSLGAYQNRLEHTTTNLDVTSENMTSAYSRIMDAITETATTKWIFERLHFANFVTAVRIKKLSIA